MRATLLVALAACGPDVDGHTHDANTNVPQDADPNACTALAGTASVDLSVDALVTHFGRLDAGGIWNTGPAAAVGAPMSLTLLFTNADPLSPNEAYCCMSGVSDCGCSVDGLAVTTDMAVTYGAEIGNWPIHVHRFMDANLSLTGTLSITQFSHPFEHAPGRITGSVSAIANVYTVSGSFDNAFCQALLSATI